MEQDLEERDLKQEEKKDPVNKLKEEN